MPTDPPHRPPAPLRVLHVIHSGARGGGSAHLNHLLPALSSHRIAAAALVGDDGPLATQLRARGVPTQTWSPPVARKSWVASAHLWRAANEARADVVHLHGTRAACLWTCASLAHAHGARVPSLYTAHMIASAAATHALGKRARLWVDQVACFGKDKVICVGEDDSRAFAQARMARAAQLVYAPNAVDAQRYALVRERRASLRHRARAELHLAPNTPLIVCVARLVPQKDVMLLAKALERLPQAHALVLGDGPDAECLSAAPAAHERRLHLLGGRDDVEEWLIASDVLALPSRWESQGIVLLEAMAAGIPWVATATSGARALHRRANVGTLVPIGDSEALARALHRAWTQDSRHEICAGDTYLRSWTWNDAAARHAALYRDVVASAAS